MENQTIEPLNEYIHKRHNELSGDEILHVLDERNYPEVDHFEKVGAVYRMWDTDGKYFEFKKREWS